MLEGDIIQMDGSTQKEERDAINKVIIFCEEFLSPLTFLLFTLYIGVTIYAAVECKSSGECLNLTAATRIIIVDPS